VHIYPSLIDCMLRALEVSWLYVTLIVIVFIIIVFIIRHFSQSSQPIYHHSYTLIFPDVLTLYVPRPIISLPFPNVQFGKRAFSFSARSVWNSIPIEIWSSPFLPSFKRHLKSYFFANPSVSSLVMRKAVNQSINACQLPIPKVCYSDIS